MNNFVIQFFLVSVFFCFSVLLSSQALAKEKTLRSVSTKLEAHFDRDKNGEIDQMELMNLRTHQVLHYPLVEKDNQRPYDVDGDLMLEPHEMQQYMADKVSGRLKKVYKDYVDKEKLKERRRKERLRQIEVTNEKLKAH